MYVEQSKTNRIYISSQVALKFVQKRSVKEFKKVGQCKIGLSMEKVEVVSERF